jgi:hypothetical protein
MVRNTFHANFEAQYGPDDFVNPEAFDSQDMDQRAYVLLDGGLVTAVVFAEYPTFCEDDALGVAAGAGRLDAFRLTDAELADYQTGTDGDGKPEYDGVVFLGGKQEPFALESLECWAVSARQFSEDPALMSLDRVLAALDRAADDAFERANRAPDDLGYADAERYEDAITRARIVSMPEAGK